MNNIIIIPSFALLISIAILLYCSRQSGRWNKRKVTRRQLKLQKWIVIGNGGQAIQSSYERRKYNQRLIGKHYVV